MPQHRNTATPSERPPALRRRWSALLLTVLLSLVAALAGAVPPASADGLGGPDRLSISGYDLETDGDADVVADSTGNNLVLRVEPGGPLTDGTVVLTLPRPAWRSALHVGFRLYAGDPSVDGSVVVRPSETVGDLGPGDCRGESGPPTVTVLNTAKAHVAVVSHLRCEQGQSLTVRVFGIRAPRATGRYVLPVSVSDADGQRGPSSVALRVVKKPATTLRVDVPETVAISTPQPLLLRAVRPDGRLDAGYRGTVALQAVEDPDCTFSLADGTRSTTFTAADGGAKVLAFSVRKPVSHRIVAYDVARRANAARSEPYQVVGDEELTVCSVSYH